MLNGSHSYNRGFMQQGKTCTGNHACHINMSFELDSKQSYDGDWIHSIYPKKMEKHWIMEDVLFPRYKLLPTLPQTTLFTFI